MEHTVNYSGHEDTGVEKRFLDSGSILPVTEGLRYYADRIREHKDASIIHDVKVTDGNEYQKQKVLVVPGQIDADKPPARITTIMHPQFASGPELESTRGITAALAATCGMNVVFPHFPGVGKDGVLYSALTKNQMLGLLDGTFSRLSEGQWQAMLSAEGSEENNAGEFLSNPDQRLLFFGHSQGNNGNAGLISTLPPQLRQNVMGMIWSELPDVNQEKIYPKQVIGLATRMLRNLGSISLYEKDNESMGIGWRGESKLGKSLRATRDLPFVAAGPVAITRRSLSRDLRTAHVKNTVDFRGIPQAIFRGGQASTTLQGEQDLFHELLTEELQAPVLIDETLEGENHAYLNSIPVVVHMVQKSLAHFKRS